MRRPAAAMVALALGACGQVDWGAPPTAPVNACPQFACAAYAQIPKPKCVLQSICAAQSAIPLLTYVVTLPETSFYAPGATFVVQRSTLASCGTATSTSCFRMPAFGEIAGSYAAEAAIYYAPSNPNAPHVPFYLGDPPLPRSVPVQASFRPIFSFDPNAPKAYVDVTLLGLDLQPVFATPTVRQQSTQALPGPTAPGVDPGNDNPNVGFDAFIPLGEYEETLMPVAPYDVFPPVTTQISSGDVFLNRSDPHYANQVLGAAGPLSALGDFPVVVTRAGTTDLDGWTLYLRDDRTLRRISSLARLHQPDTVHLYTVAQSAAPGEVSTIRDHVELVLHPADPTMPDLVAAALSNAVPNAAPYPLLPPPVEVAGAVTGEDGTPVRAHVVLESTSIATLASTLGKDLHYQVQLDTALDGTYARALPPGTYTAIVVPEPSSGFAKSQQTLQVSVPAYVGERQDGKKLVVSRPARLHGHVTTADGRVVTGAEVEAHASAALVYAPNQQDRDPNRWPRTFRTQTTESGDFDLTGLDPNASYDVVARPAAGSAFPWSILQQVGVGAPESVTEVTMNVAAPLLVDEMLREPTKNQPIADALVRAFAPSCVDTAAACANPGGHWVPMELGRARTDATGHLVLYLDNTSFVP